VCVCNLDLNPTVSKPRPRQRKKPMPNRVLEERRKKRLPPPRACGCVGGCGWVCEEEEVVERGL
jgi:hypothetical protein